MDEIAKLFSKLADQYGPSVIEAAKSAAQIEGYSSLAGSLIAVGIGSALLFGGNCLRKMKCKDSFDDGPAHVFGYILIACAVVPFAIAAWAWVDPWTWAAINHPELWIAKKVLKL